MSSSIPDPGARHGEPDTSDPTYRRAYGRINALVVVGEGLADRHFRLLARAIPDGAEELRRLAAMEGRHARDFVGCAAQLGIRPALDQAMELFAPLHGLFLSCDRAGDVAGCLTLQGLIVECFAMAAYRAYLPVADAEARVVTAEVLADEAHHLHYGEVWLRQRFPVVRERVAAVSRRALPIALAILEAVRPELEAIGMDAAALVADFVWLFQQALEAIGFTPAEGRRLLASTLAALQPG